MGSSKATRRQSLLKKTQPPISRRCRISSVSTSRDGGAPASPPRPFRRSDCASRSRREGNCHSDLALADLALLARQARHGNIIDHRSKNNDASAFKASPKKLPYVRRATYGCIKIYSVCTRSPLARPQRSPACAAAMRSMHGAVKGLRRETGPTTEDRPACAIRGVARLYRLR